MVRHTLPETSRVIYYDKSWVKKICTSNASLPSFIAKFVRVNRYPLRPGAASTSDAPFALALWQYLHGSWDRTSDRDTAGGPLRLVDENKGVKNNPKWCQNPQYLLNIPAGCVTLAVRRP